ncbi:unnamed protein product [Caenorhabditis auriculariae]|uniref:Uncharacterized protein n=1 Tax=Caenorhabditis auriculariae TaxID=2777116 RepID=A0A8S1HE04_9PELO|nr:unnamed protein product [Caenorhabditis auriculariae]
MNSHEPEDFTDISTPSFSTMASFHCPLPKVLRKFFTSTYWATLAIAQLSYIYCCHGKWKAAPLLAAAALLLSSVAILLFVDPLDPENRELLASLKYGNEELTVEVDVLKFKDVIDIEETQLSLHRFLKEIELLSSLFPVSVWPRSFVEYVTEMQPNFDKEFSASSYSECVTHLKNSSQSQMYAMACRVYCISRGDDCKGEGNFDGFFKDDSIVHGKLFYAALVGWHHEKIDDAQVWSSRIQPRPPSPHVFFARPASKKDQNHTEPSLQSFQLVFELRRTSWSYLQTAVKEVENICSKHLRSQHLSFRLKGTLFSAAQREIYIQKLRLTLVPWIFFAGFASVFQLGFKTSSMLSTISTLLYIEFSAISRFFDVKYQNALFLITLLVSLTAYSMGFSLCIAVSPQKVRRLSPLKIYNLVSKYWVALMIVFTTLYPLNYYYQLGLSSLISVLLCGLLSSAFGALIVLPQLIRLVGINIENADKRACERYLEARVFHRKQKLKEMNRQKRIVWDRCSGLEAPPNTLSTSRTRSSSRQTGPSTSSEFSSVLSTEGSNDFEVEDEDEEVRETIRQLRERWTRQKTDNSFLENVTHADEALQNLKLERAERNKRKEELIATIEEKTKREEKEEEMGIEEAAEPQAVHPLAQHFPPNFTWEMIEFITNPNNRGGIPWSPFEPSPAQELILAPNVEAVIMEEDDDEPDEQAREEQESDESGEEVNHVNDDRGGDGDAESSDDPSNDEWLEEDEGFGADVV